MHSVTRIVSTRSRTKEPQRQNDIDRSGDEDTRTVEQYSAAGREYRIIELKDTLDTRHIKY